MWQSITRINIFGRGISLLQAEHTYDKTWRQLTNARGHTLRCSHYLPSPFPEDASLPCVIYCHGNRADANEAAVMLLPSNITVFTLDFSGSGLSDGDYVSLGWHERDDLKVVVSYLRSNKQISRIVVNPGGGESGKGIGEHYKDSRGSKRQWFYGNLDHCILGGMVGRETRRFLKGGVEADEGFGVQASPESQELPNLYVVDNLSTSIVFSEVKMAVQYMRRIIEKKAKFDIMDLNCLQVSSKTFIPALFGHAKDDKFIPNHHSDLIYKSYAGDKNIIYFDGDHNSSRPQFYYDSVSIFFYNVLHPPQISSHSCKLEKYYDLGDLKIGAGLDEIITGVHSAGTDVASSSSAPPAISTTKCVGELLSEIAPVTTVVDSVHEEADILSSHEPSHLEPAADGPKLTDDAKPFFSRPKLDGGCLRRFSLGSGILFTDLVGSVGGLGAKTVPTQPKPCPALRKTDQPNDQNEECCSYTSSNRESWGRCSSLGGSDEESSADCTAADSRHQDLSASIQVKTLKVLTMPLRCMQQKSSELKKEEKKKKKVPIVPKKPKSEKFEKLEALSKRLRLCILKRVPYFSA
ncbi:alpha/beta-Hydrolases superfamily protein [Prunus dulcis]|uniref:Alpha/beta-Hydrolases superfamily protein n=1 Tax=Prunus dulcis TaxID=3755 RepID=A0A4Y1R9C5_PRUDU|nr:alpha/beta-Hydrolases superfamily protein [Prunus dulcis]